MKCDLHSNQTCVEACGGCGRLLCSACDVLYMGKHYCKTCVAGVAVPLARFNPRPRTWFVALLDKLTRRWYALILLSIGLIALGAGVLMVEEVLTHQASQFEFTQSASGTMYSEHYTYAGNIRTIASIALEAGAVLVLGGICLIAKRFSLRWLLAGVVAVAAVSAYPFLRVPGHPELTHEVIVDGPIRLSSHNVEQIRSRLQPDAALATLPSALRQELQLHPGSVHDVRVAAHGKSGVRCEIEFDSDLSEEARLTLAQFYQRYAVGLLCDNTQALWSNPGSLWSKYEADWLKQQGPLLLTQAQNAP